MYKKNSSAPLALQMLITSVYLCLIENHVNIGQINALFLHCSFIFFFFFTCFILQISYDCFFNAGILSFKGSKSPPYSRTS